MEHITTKKETLREIGAGVTYHSLRDALNTTDVSINRFHLEPHVALPWGLHAHYDQEEIFLVTDGTVTFETLQGEVTVQHGEAIRFSKGEYQAARNDGDEPAAFFAIGAPPESTDIRVPLPCENCDSEGLRLDEQLVCPTCGAARSPLCANCGEDEREVHLDAEAKTIVDRCAACGNETAVRSLT